VFHGQFPSAPVRKRHSFGVKESPRATESGGRESYQWAATPQASASKMPVAGNEALGYSRFIALGLYSASVFGTFPGGTTMEWTTPQHEVIDLNCEVSSYANAEL
jgi:hypothetical protein